MFTKRNHQISPQHSFFSIVEKLFLEIQKKMNFDTLNPLDCITCGQLLSEPCLLPCGHTICSEHHKDSSFYVYCRVCDIKHEKPESNWRFPPNLLARNLLERKLQHIDLGNVHKSSLEMILHLGKLLKEVDRLRENPRDEINRVITGVKNAIDLKKEHLKRKIENEALELVEQLDEFEKKCMGEANSMMEINLARIFEDSETIEMLRLFEDDYASWRRELSLFVGDAERWRQIENDCDRELEKMSELVEQLRGLVFLDEYYDQELKLEKFGVNNKEPLL